MKPADMLHQMCHGLLAGTDVKALCKARGFPPEAVKSAGILETMFLSPQGLSDLLGALEPTEIALLHLLKHTPAEVDISFFSRAYGGAHPYGTFNQRFERVFTKVKQRLIRGGLLLWGEVPQRGGDKQSKMERWRFALPAQFHTHLPPLIPAPRQLDGDGDWRPNVVRDKLRADLGGSGSQGAEDGFQIEAGELQLCGKTFEPESLLQWQKSGWKQAIAGDKKPGSKDRHSKPPHEAMLCILTELPDGQWADAGQLTTSLQVFCGQKKGAEALCDVVCRAGWTWGALAKQQADGKTWYRLSPQPPHVPPIDYLSEGNQQDSVMVNLTTVPLEALAQIVTISDQRPNTKNTLLITPNFVKLGRADDKLLAAEVVAWLLEHTRPFAEARVKLGERRGRTILHENVMIARVSDLSLKVAIEKALGGNVVSLKNDFIAFPRGSLEDVRRVVKKSGHVVKEVAAR